PHTATLSRPALRSANPRPSLRGGPPLGPAACACAAPLHGPPLGAAACACACDTPFLGRPSAGALRLRVRVRGYSVARVSPATSRTVWLGHGASGGPET